MNCKKHGRLIVAILGVDTPQEKSYCIDCIEELESFKSHLFEIKKQITGLLG